MRINSAKLINVSQGWFIILTPRLHELVSRTHVHTWLSGLDDGAATSCHCTTCWLHRHDSVGHSSRWWEGKSLVAPDFKGTALPAELWNRLSGNDQLRRKPGRDPWLSKRATAAGQQATLRGSHFTKPSPHSHWPLSRFTTQCRWERGRKELDFFLSSHSLLAVVVLSRLAVSNGERCTINACADYPTTRRRRADCHFLSPCYHYAVSWTGYGQSQAL